MCDQAGSRRQTGAAAPARADPAQGTRTAASHGTSHTRRVEADLLVDVAADANAGAVAADQRLLARADKFEHAVAKLQPLPWLECPQLHPLAVDQRAVARAEILDEQTAIVERLNARVLAREQRVLGKERSGGRQRRGRARSLREEEDLALLRDRERGIGEPLAVSAEQNVEERRLRRVGHDLDALDGRKSRPDCASMLDVGRDQVQTLVEGQLGRDDERVQGDDVPAVAALPDARLRDQLRVAGEPGARQSPEILVEGDVDAVEERADLRVRAPAVRRDLPEPRAVQVQRDPPLARPLGLLDEIVPLRQQPAERALGNSRSRAASGSWIEPRSATVSSRLGSPTGLPWRPCSSW
jgi:hypothetical protein